MRTIRNLAALIVFALPAAAQFTTVSGTVTDPNGLAYSYGTIASTIVSSGTPLFSSNSQPYFQPVAASGLDINGKFIVRLADNSLLTPGGSTWNFTVCSAVGTVQPAFGKGPICFTVTGVTISGASQDIGATLRAAAPALTANFSGGGTPCTTTNTSVQYDNSGAFGCTDLLFTAGTTPAYASSGTWVLTPNATQGSSFTGFQSSNVVAFTGSSSVNGTAANISLNDQSNNASIPINAETILALSFIPSSHAQASIGTIAGVTLSVQGSGFTNETNQYGIQLSSKSGTGTGATITNNRNIEMTSSVASLNTITNDTDLYIRSPLFNAGGTYTHKYGIFIEDQSVTGAGSNPDPHSIHQVGNAPNEFQGHINQIAANNWAGTCAMSTSTTCTFTISAGFTSAPVGVCSIDQASAVPATANSCKVSVSGTTVTITAGASNSLTWDAILIGNPN